NEHQSEGEIVVLLLDITKESYSILFDEIGEGSISESTSKLASAALKKFDNPGLIICSTGLTTKGEYFDGESFVRSLETNFGPERLFFGGMAGDDWTFSGSYVFNHQQETDKGMVALVLDMNKIYMNGMAITGWKPM